jgi:hypothetical protein
MCGLDLGLLLLFFRSALAAAMISTVEASQIQ